jgi:hypothetical protein
MNLKKLNSCMIYMVSRSFGCCFSAKGRYYQIFFHCTKSDNLVVSFYALVCKAVVKP